ncbi:MAG: hypothetical protein HY040_01860 [Planctomycetes bacterium]|nr:hypothetical protein [Planctomycetota bacterium]
MMRELQNGVGGTDRIPDAADRLDDTNNATDGTRRTKSPAFENWLIEYRHRLAKVLEGKTSETSAEQMQAGGVRARV